MRTRRSGAGLVVFALTAGFVLGFVWHRYHLPPAGMGLVDGSGPPPATAEILAREPDYGLQDALVRTSIYVPRQYSIVMLGNSLTAGGRWNELLGRDDVANRGVGSDQLTKFADRLDQVFAVKPKVVFILGGINDLRNARASVETVVAAYRGLVDAIAARGIRPIVQTLPYTHLDALNRKVEKLNDAIKAMAHEKGVEVLDLTPLLSKNKMIVPKYTTDGVHLSTAGYRIWRDALLREFARLKF